VEGVLLVDWHLGEPWKIISLDEIDVSVWYTGSSAITKGDKACINDETS